MTLWLLLPANQLDHYRRGAPDTEDFKQELREVLGRLTNELLLDLAGFEEPLEFESPPGTYFDAFPTSIISQQSPNAINSLEGKSRFDLRCFRPNLLVDISGPDHFLPEQAWVGKTLPIDGLKVRIDSICPDCSMTIHACDIPPQDAQMRKLFVSSEGKLGIYASVVQAGKVSAGDPVSMVQRPSGARGHPNAAPLSSTRPVNAPLH